jgi:regulatory LuxR family protein
VIEHALELSPPPGPRAALSQLAGDVALARGDLGAAEAAMDEDDRDIAAELFISAKTASVHVSNIPAKLGAANRTEAAAAAHQAGLAAEDS